MSILFFIITTFLEKTSSAYIALILVAVLVTVNLFMGNNFPFSSAKNLGRDLTASSLNTLKLNFEVQAATNMLENQNISLKYSDSKNSFLEEPALLNLSSPALNLTVSNNSSKKSAK